MRIFKILSAAVLTLALGAGMVLAQTVDDIKSRGTVRIAIDTNNPPWGMMDASMQPDGNDVAVAKMLAKYLGVELEIVPVTSQNRIPYVLSGQADLVISSLTITPERAQQIWFSIPYAMQESVIMAHKDAKIESFEDLAGKKVSIVRGAIQEPLLVSKVPTVEMMRYDSDASTIQAVTAGQVDAAAVGFLTPAAVNKTQGADNYQKKLSLGQQHFGIGMKRGNTDLLQWVNTFIYHVRQNGELSASFERFAAQPLPPMPSY
jgi:polar amino acid transport system substrate-binding protein